MYISAGMNLLSGLTFSFGGAIAPITQWTTKLTALTAETIYEIDYSPSLNLYVCSGSTGTILTSPDGNTWTVRSSGVSVSLFSVLWNGSAFIACGDSGTVITSTDGINWVTRTSGTTTTLTSAAYSPELNRTVIVGQAGIIVSTDTITWNVVTVTPAILLDITWDGTKFTACGDDQFICTSTDGITWKYVSSGVDFGHVNYLNGLYIVGGAVKTLLTSQNGTDYYIRDSQGTTVNGVVWDGTRYLAVGSSGSVITSSDGITWTKVTVSGLPALEGIVWTGSLFVACSGTSIYTSTDGISWTQRSTGATTNLTEIVWSGSRFVAVGASGATVTSTDGINWTANYVSFNDTLNEVHWTGTKFIAVSSSSTIYSTTDGVNWIIESSNTNWSDTLYVSSIGKTVVVGPNTMVGVSTDHLTYYYKRLDSGNVSFNDAYWDGSRLLVLSSSGIWSSADGDTWTKISTTGGTSIVYEPSLSLYVMVAANISTSTDAITWTTRQTGGLTKYSVAWSPIANRFVVSANGGTIYTSIDGITWTSSTPFGASFTGRCVIWHNDKFILTGGGYVFTSADGITWTQRATGLAVIEDIIWDGAQYVGIGSYGEVITSPDGISWTTRTTTGRQPSLSFGVTNAITYTGTKYITGGGAGTIYGSLNVIDWTLEQVSSSEYTSGKQTAGSGIAGDDSLLVLANYTNLITSTDGGKTWTTRYTNPSVTTIATNQYIVKSNDLYVATSNDGGIFTSSNGTSWTTTSFRIINTSGTSLSAITYSPTLSTYVMVGPASNYITSGASVTRADLVARTYNISGADNIFNSTWSQELGIFAVVGATGRCMTSIDGITWVDRTATSSTANSLYGLIWNSTHSKFVAGGVLGTITTSLNGELWVKSMTKTSLYSNPIAYSSSLNMLLVTGTDGSIITSTDAGETWNFQSSGTTKALYNAVWASELSLFVVVGATGFIATSPDGITWTARTSNTTNNLLCVAWNGTSFVAAGNNGTVRTSTDGITWTTRSSGTSSIITTICWVPTLGKFFFGTNAEEVRSSTDGTTWAAAKSSLDSTIYNISWYDNSMVISGYNGRAMRSTDAQTWYLMNTIGDFKSSRISSDGKVIIGCSGGIFIETTDLQNFKVLRADSAFNSQYIQAIAYSPSLDVYVAQLYVSSFVRTANGGNTWTYPSRPNSQTAQFAHWVDELSLFIVYSTGGRIWTSPDGTTWTQRTSPTTQGIYGAAYAPSISTLVAVGNSGAVIRSTDGGTTWSLTTIGSSSLRSVAWSPSLSLFVACGSSGYIYSSPDGITWTQRRQEANSLGVSEVIWDGAQFVVAGQGADNLTAKVFKSSNGSDWTEVTMPAGPAPVGIVYKSGTYLLPAARGVIWKTADLNNFTTVFNAYSLPTINNACTYYGGQYIGTGYVFAGQNNGTTGVVAGVGTENTATLSQTYSGTIMRGLVYIPSMNKVIVNGDNTSIIIGDVSS